MSVERKGNDTVAYPVVEAYREFIKTPAARLMDMSFFEGLSSLVNNDKELIDSLLHRGGEVMRISSSDHNFLRKLLVEEKDNVTISALEAIISSGIETMFEFNDHDKAELTVLKNIVVKHLTINLFCSLGHFIEELKSDKEAVVEALSGRVVTFPADTSLFSKILYELFCGGCEKECNVISLIDVLKLDKDIQDTINKQ